MKEFSQKILIIPVDDAPANITAPFTGFDELHSDVDIDPSCEPNQQSGNLYYKFQLRITQRNLSSTLITKYGSMRPSIMLLFDTDGNFYQVGTQETPVRAAVNPVRLSYEIKFTATLIDSPF